MTMAAILSTSAIAYQDSSAECSVPLEPLSFVHHEAGNVRNIDFSIDTMSHKSAIFTQNSAKVIVGGSHGPNAALAQIDLNEGQVVDFAKVYEAASDVLSILDFESHILALASVRPSQMKADAGIVLLSASKTSGELTRAPVFVSERQSESAYGHLSVGING